MDENHGNKGEFETIDASWISSDAAGNFFKIFIKKIGLAF